MTILRSNVSHTRDDGGAIRYLAEDPVWSVMNDAHKAWLSADSEMKDARRDWRDYGDDASLDSYIRAYDRLSVASRAKDTVHDYFATIAESKIEQGGIIEEWTGPLGEAEVYASFPELSEGWHNTRRAGIGGSEAGKLLGIDWRAEPGRKDFRKITDDELEELYDETVKKKSHHISIEEPEVDYGLLQRGHKWERVSIAFYGLEHGVRVAQSKDTFQGPEEFQHVNVDGIVMDDDGNAVGLIECKTTGRKSYWRNGVPMSYRVQVLYYLHAVGLPWADVIVRYDEDGTFDTFRINATDTVTGHPDAMDIDDVIRELRDVWKMIEEKRSDDYMTGSERHAAEMFEAGKNTSIINVDVSLKKTNIFNTSPASVILTGISGDGWEYGPYGVQSQAKYGWLEPVPARVNADDWSEDAEDIVDTLSKFDILACSNPDEASIAIQQLFSFAGNNRVPLIVSSAAL